MFPFVMELKQKMFLRLDLIPVFYEFSYFFLIEILNFRISFKFEFIAVPNKEVLPEYKFLDYIVGTFVV